MVLKKSYKKYLDHRRELIKEERELMYQRDEINKRLRELRQSLASWDNWLVTK